MIFPNLFFISFILGWFWKLRTMFSMTSRLLKKLMTFHGYLKGFKEGRIPGK